MDNPFAHVWLFLWSVVSHVFTLAAGCVVTVVLGLLEKYVWKRPISWKAEIGILVLFIFIASFQAWRDQYTAANTAEARMEEFTKPKLSLDAGKAIAPSVADPRNTILTLSGIVKNTGSPTIFNNWGVKIRFNDGRTIDGKEIRPPQNIPAVEMYDTQGHLAVVLHTNHHWAYTGPADPVPTGGGRAGWVQFLIPNVTVGEIRSKRPTAVFFVEDVNGRIWTFEQQFVDKEALPDLRELMAPPHKQKT